MKTLYRIVALGSVVGVAAIGACTGSAPSPQGPQPDAMLVNPEDAPVALDGSDGGLVLSTSVRIGHLVPELGPVRVCVLAPGSNAWTPLFGALSAGDAGPSPEGDAGGSDADSGEGPDAPPMDAMPLDSAMEGGPSDGRTEADAPVRDAQPGDASPSPGQLDPLTLTRYQRLDGAGTFELEVLPASAGSCSKGYFTQALTLDSDRLTTIVLAQTRPGPLGPPTSYLGDESVPFGFLAFTDEPGPGSVQARTRFINAVVPVAADAGGGPLSVSVQNSTADLVSIAAVVPPDMPTSPSDVPPVVDAFGYHDGYAMSGACTDASNIGCLAFRIGPSAGGGPLPWTSASGNLGLGPRSVHTAFILSGGGVEFKVLWCNDLSQSTALSDCVTIGQ